jgi:hypothetical protein
MMTGLRKKGKGLQTGAFQKEQKGVQPLCK